MVYEVAKVSSVALPTTHDRSLRVYRPLPRSLAGAPRLPALTSLRFFAAAMIVLFHSLGLFGTSHSFFWYNALDKGIAFFFVLSGFILMYVYPSLDARDAVRFFVTRVARIWPMHAVALFLAMLIIPAQFFAPQTYRVGAIALNLALLHYWFPNHKYSFNPVSWTLSIELFFYACFPLLLWRWQRLWRWFVGLACLYTAGCVVVGNLLGLWTPFPPLGPHARDFFLNGPVSFLFPFLIGMATASCWRTVHTRVTIRRSMGTLLEGGALVFAGLAALVSEPVATRASRVPWIGPPGGAWIQEFAVAVVPFAALIFVMALECGWLSRLLAYAPLVLLGEISYSLYLLHATFTAFYLAHGNWFSRFPTWLLLPAYWAVCLLASYLGWRMIERPCRRLIVTWWDRRFLRTGAGTVDSAPAPIPPTR